MSNTKQLTPDSFALSIKALKNFEYSDEIWVPHIEIILSGKDSGDPEMVTIDKVSKDSYVYTDMRYCKVSEIPNIDKFNLPFEMKPEHEISIIDIKKAVERQQEN